MFHVREEKRDLRAAGSPGGCGDEVEVAGALGSAGQVLLVLLRNTCFSRQCGFITGASSARDASTGDGSIHGGMSSRKVLGWAVEAEVLTREESLVQVTVRQVHVSK